MPDGGHKVSFVQGYNAQIVVDGQGQVIVAAEVSQATNDKHQLAAMLEQVEQNVGAKPQAASADTGYWDPKQVGDAHLQGIDLYVATRKQKHGEVRPSAENPPPTASPVSVEVGLLAGKMKQKLKTEVGRNLYRMRKAIVEPVFRHIKEWRGFRRFSFRGLQKVRAEWKLICLTHNLLKLFRPRKAFQMT